MTSGLVVEGIVLLLLAFVGSWMAAVVQMRRSGIGSPQNCFALAAVILTVAGPYILAQLAWWHFSIELVPWTLLGILPACAVVAWLRLRRT